MRQNAVSGRDMSGGLQQQIGGGGGATLVGGGGVQSLGINLQWFWWARERVVVATSFSSLPHTPLPPPAQSHRQKTHLVGEVLDVELEVGDRVD